MWGPIISAGASIISRLFGGKKSSNRINYKQMVRDAEAAGFNPLTALRNGGAAGYMQGGNGTPLSRLADGLGGIASDFLNNFDPFEDDKRELEFKLVEAQLANLQADTAMKTRFGDVPSYTATPQHRVMGNGVKHGQTFKTATDNAQRGYFDEPVVPEGVEPMPLEIPMKARDGTIVYGPNPDGPDLDQLLVPPVLYSQRGYERAASTAVDMARNPGDIVKVRRMSTGRKDYKRKSNRWWPSFELRWD